MSNPSRGRPRSAGSVRQIWLRSSVSLLSVPKSHHYSCVVIVWDLQLTAEIGNCSQHNYDEIKERHR